MLQAAVRAAATRPAARATRAAFNRTLFTTALRRSSDSHHVDKHHVDAHAPGLFGVGSKPGKISTDDEQATGLERLELLGEMQGVNVFDEEPLDSSRLGTLDNPIQVFSLVCTQTHFFFIWMLNAWGRTPNVSLAAPAPQPTLTTCTGSTSTTSETAVAPSVVQVNTTLHTYDYTPTHSPFQSTTLTSRVTVNS